MSKSFAPLFATFLWGLVPACLPARVAAAANSHDEPLPAQEGRAVLRIELDLPRTGSCEEDFDLALYAHRGVELIEWAAGTQKCRGRRVAIRYVPSRIDSEQLTKRVKQLAQEVRPLTHE